MRLLWFLATYFSILPLKAQVYFAAYRSDQVFVGPANIDVLFEGIGAYYSTKIKNEIDGLQFLITELDSLETRNSPDKNERRRLAHLRGNFQLILTDIDNLNQLKSIWDIYNDQLATNTAIDQLCFTLVDTATATDSGLELEVYWEAKTVIVKEFLELICGGSQWVKKESFKGSHTLSDDAEIWCMTAKNCFLKDMYSTEVPFENLEKFPDFKYEEASRRLTRINYVPLAQPVEVLSAKDGKEQIPISKLNVFKCNE